MTRRDHDAYYTPDDAVRILHERRPLIGKPGEVVCEPCVGGGAIAQPFRDRGCLVVTNDLVPTIEADTHNDACSRPTWDQLQTDARARLDGSGRQWDNRITLDWTVTNPPFVAAMEILQQAYAHSRLGVAFFLRLSFLEPTEDRGPWLAEHPPDELIVLPRISFTGDGATDSVTCAWMIWYKPQTIVLQSDHVVNMTIDAPHCGRPIEVIAKPADGDDSQQSLWGV